MTAFNVEYTDTFGGEANYCWVRRATVDESTGSRRALMRKAKAAVSLTGVRGVTHDHGDMIEFRPYGSCTVLFVTVQS